ncbi:MAG: putative glycoside hydrolase [Patescibacteria group bacterium]|nr:putative glycoside hydrolase [Patescibacteria group bacterium]
MIKKISQICLNVVLLGCIAVTVFYLFTQRTTILAQADQLIFNNNRESSLNVEIKKVKREKPAEREVRALYLTANTASQDNRIAKIIEFMKGSALNAVVIDIKSYSGKIVYDSQVPQVIQLQTKQVIIKDIPALIQKLHDNDIYVIARQTVFQDLELSGKKPSWAVQNKVTGGVWHDKNGLGWMDPSVEEVWQYNSEIAREAILLGFDEVNFDYIRFPSDGDLTTMAFHNLAGRTKRGVMKSFFEYLSGELKDQPGYMSVDLFGLTSVRLDDMNIGQNIEDAGPNFDYICPMVYPSHYPTKYMGFVNPADHPYEIINHDLTIANERLAHVANNRAKIRPWLQDFNMGAVYTPAMLDLEIKAQKDSGSFGYLLWNAGNVYTYAPKL